MTFPLSRSHTPALIKQNHPHHSVGTAPSGPDAKAAAERALRLFDLDTRFGPCACISRRARWERAAALGLDPPAEVLRLLDVPGVKQQGLWYGRL
jgi:DNA polymerase delta subunit 4